MFIQKALNVKTCSSLSYKIVPCVATANANKRIINIKTYSNRKRDYNNNNGVTIIIMA